MIRSSPAPTQPAKIQKRSPARYAGQYQEQLEALNVLRPTDLPRVSANIQQIIQMIQGLIDKGFAYATPGGDV